MEEEIDTIRRDDQIEEVVKKEHVKKRMAESIVEVLEEVEVLIDTHFFDEFSETKSSPFPKKVIAAQGSIEMRPLKKTWSTLKCSPKTLKVIQEIQENLLCVGKRRNGHQKEVRDKMLVQQCWASSQREVHRQLLQEGLRRDQHKARHCCECPPEQRPCPERADLPRTEIGRSKDGEVCQR